MSEVIGIEWTVSHEARIFSSPAVMASEKADILISERGDYYHQGVITKLFPSNNTGVVRTESGRELTFDYNLVIVCGEAKNALDLKVGDQVGYDLGWTSSQLKITKIKTYPPRLQAGRSDSER
jgi:hypothetical protein